jgi:hypothetical protein
MMVCYTSVIMEGLCNRVYTKSTYWLHLCVKKIVTITLLHSKIVVNGINSLCGGPVSYTAMSHMLSFLNGDYNGQSFQYVVMGVFATMHATSDTS